MSSINTNTGAMVALQTLKSINSNLSKVQSEISTGKSIDSAKDNAAVWAIAKTMEADVSGFKKISDGLSSAESTVSVARNAAESITGLLNQVKDQIVQAKGASNADERQKIQNNISALRDQVASVVGAAQFNGVNLINNGDDMDVLSSLNRDSSGNVATASINVKAQDLSIGGYVAANAFTTDSTGVTAATDRTAFTLGATGGTGSIAIDTSTMTVGDSLNLTIGDQTVSVKFSQEIADAGAAAQQNAAMAVAMKNAIDSLAIQTPGTPVPPATTADPDRLTIAIDGTNANQITFTNDTANSLSVSAQYLNEGSGKLGGLSAIDVTGGDSTGANAALASIDGLIKTAIDAAAAFGTSQNQLETQNDFVSKLMDSMKTGIGAMVDADMEATSARLQALQVQQQLATQSLSIANQAPQNLLSLFR
ncbi:flagellin [Rhodovulum euryhalinum]|uniref:Flagellin n=1 Tax=Rhodovulum euryhalinum TaxID=35805 RepID=A0A4R2KJC0_9RHOB|nr:flagellin [Rhodovulum euryhalinum]TCO73354.1 flagellin [Rhodovulum euryhalinum]